MSKIIVSLSGGMDSATLLGEALSQGHEVIPVSFIYGSKHGTWEVEAGDHLCIHYGLHKGKCMLLDLRKLFINFRSNLLQSGGGIPEGHYEAESMRQTVVPGRNIIFASILAGLAWSNDCTEVWMGIHAGDHFIYPDCRPNFFFAMKEAVEHGTDRKVTLSAPFLHLTKTTILRRGLELDVPYYLTRTCYQNQPIACGKCGSCQERLEAFKNNGIPDPLDYKSRDLLPK